MSMRPCFVEHRWKLPSPVGGWVGHPDPAAWSSAPAPAVMASRTACSASEKATACCWPLRRFFTTSSPRPACSTHTPHRQPSHTYTCSNSVTNGSAIEYRAPPPPRAGPRPPLRCGPLSGTPTWACARPAPGPPRPNAERKESEQQQRKEIAVCQPALAVAGKRSERPGGVTLTPSRRPPPVTVP